MPTVDQPCKYNHFHKSTYTDSRFPGVTYTHFNVNENNVVLPGQRITTSNPSYRIQIAKGQNATTNYTNRKGKVIPYGHIVTCKFKQSATSLVNSKSMHIYCPDLSTLIGPVDDAALQDIAFQRLKSRLANVVGNADLMAPVAELRELRGLVRQTANLAIDVTKALIDIKRTKGKSALDFAADAWLGFNFGVRPLIADTNKAIDSVNSFLNRNDQSVRLVGSSNKEWFSKGTDVNLAGALGAGSIVSIQIHHQLSYRCVAGFDLNLRSGNNYNLAEHLGFSYTKLPSTLWELTPFSWVADYFGTVGNYLSDTFTSPPGDTKYVSLNKKYTAKVILSGRKDAGIGGVTDYSRTDFFRQGYAEYIHFTRTSLSSLPRAALRFKTQDELGFSAVSKLLNLSAILAKSK